MERRVHPVISCLSRAMLLLGALLLFVPTVAGASGPVVVLTAKGAVNPVLAGYIDRGITEAERRDATALVIQLDTPGGLDISMRDIVQRINAARTPVVVYVAPAGARAASAGAFITMAAHVAVMAPNTAIGAAHPVAGGGQEIEGPLKDKVVNDAVAYIRSIAQLRDRNVEWAEKAVRESISTEAEEAVKQNVVDFNADTLDDLVRQLDTRTVKLLEREVTISTQGVPVEHLEMNLIERFLYAITDPNIAYLLLSVAMMAIFLELSNPGAILPGVVGGIFLLLALFALGTLPVNIAGLLLIAFGFAMLVAEIWITSYGLLAVGGIIGLAVGSLILLSGADPVFQINPWLIALVVGSFAAFFLFIVGAIVRSRRQLPTTGLEALVGMKGVARTALDPEGTVLVHGELWRARSREGTVEADEEVVVTSMEGLKLYVTQLQTPDIINQQEEANG